MFGNLCISEMDSLWSLKQSQSLESIAILYKGRAFSVSTARSFPPQEVTGFPLLAYGTNLPSGKPERSRH